MGKTFFSKKSLFAAEPWTELFIEWLHKLPIPFWLTCTVIGITLLPGSLVWSDYIRSPTEGQFLLYSSSLILTFPYGLYILSRVKDIQNYLVNTSDILLKENFFKNIREYPFFSAEVT